VRQWQSVVSMAGDGVGVGRRPGTSCAIRALVVIGRPKPQEQEGQGQGAEVLDLEGPGPPRGGRRGSAATHWGVGDGLWGVGVGGIYPNNTTSGARRGPRGVAPGPGIQDPGRPWALGPPQVRRPTTPCAVQIVQKRKEKRDTRRREARIAHSGLSGLWTGIGIAFWAWAFLARMNYKHTAHRRQHHHPPCSCSLVMEVFGVWSLEQRAARHLN
jgi:hypothetical protein